MSVVSEVHQFKAPEKGIKHPEDIQKWENSEAYEVESCLSFNIKLS